MRGNSFFFAKQSQQQVLGADVAVSELAGFAHRELQHLLGARCIWKVGARGLRGFSLLDRFFDLLLDLVQLDVQVLQDCRGHALTLSNEAEQNVLRPDVFVMQPGRLLARHREDFSNSLGEVVAVHDALKFGIVLELPDRARLLFQGGTHITCARQIGIAL